MTEIKRYISYGGMIDCETKERTDIDSVFVRYSDIEKVLEENARLKREFEQEVNRHIETITRAERLESELKAAREELAGAYERSAQVCDLEEMHHRAMAKNVINNGGGGMGLEDMHRHKAECARTIAERIRALKGE